MPEVVLGGICVVVCPKKGCAVADSGALPPLGVEGWCAIDRVRGGITMLVPDDGTTGHNPKQDDTCTKTGTNTRMRGVCVYHVSECGRLRPNAV